MYDSSTGGRPQCTRKKLEQLKEGKWQTNAYVYVNVAASDHRRWPHVIPHSRLSWGVLLRRPKEYRRKADAATRCSGVCPHTWPDLSWPVLTWLSVLAPPTMYSSPTGANERSTFLLRWPKLELLRDGSLAHPFTYKFRPWPCQLVRSTRLLATPSEACYPFASSFLVEQGSGRSIEIFRISFQPVGQLCGNRQGKFDNSPINSSTKNYSNMNL